MLDAATKKRIDDCRDILVGKVPDPKSQVEQITIALIYKFMDDMDAEAEELGGARTFFAGPYARFGWAQLMAPSQGGYEMLALYSEAIQSMRENPGVPELFRDIFKNAYLPYRDPETLKSFLKEINGFTYDHSERLGDAFEYLLSVLGSQGDAGQFRTPRHIIDFMVAVIDPQKNDTILDPACGTAGFLISAWKHILKNNSSQRNMDERQSPKTLQTVPGDLLTPDERTRLSRAIRGYDISPDMVRLSLVNLYLHGFADPHITEYDTLTQDDKWNELADVILANPPFMSPKGGIKPHKRFSVQATRSEVLFVDYMAEHLTATGRAAIVVPEGIIFQSGTAYKALRKMLVDSSLVAVVSLPAGVFNPYSGVKTSILILDKRVHKQTDSVLFVKVQNDGFNLGAQRRAVANSDLPEATRLLRSWLTAPQAFGGDGVMAQAVARSRIGEGGGFNLTGERYVASAIGATSKYALAPIGELCDLFNGRPFRPEEWEGADSAGLPIIRIQNLNNAKNAFNYFTGAVSEKNLVASGDLLFSWSGSRGTSFGAHIWSGPQAVLNQHIFKVVVNGAKVDKRYMLHALNRAVDEIEENLHGGVGLVHITKGNLEKISVPVPPLDIQHGIVAEIEVYQKVIDGARQVVNSYKPNLSLDSSWPVLPLLALLEGKPKNGYSGQPVDYPTDTRVLSLSATTSGVLDLAKFKYLDEKIAPDATCRCKRNDIYLQRGNTRELVGTAAIFDTDAEGFIYPDLMIRVRADETKIGSRFLLHVLQSSSARDYLIRHAVGAAGSMPKINQGIVEGIPIPVPPLATQRAIVKEIEAEQALVNANRELIRRMEAKIKACIDRVWGGDAPPPPTPAAEATKQTADQPAPPSEEIEALQCT